MRRSVHPRASRGGFTLVELLIVITIIGILATLTTAAVIKAIGKGDELRLRNEISQLASSVEAFKQHFHVGYVPDRIVLPPGADPSGATQQYFKSLWPRLNPAVLLNDSFSHTYWGVPTGQTWVLQGDQCLVFFLGGTADAGGNRIGWSTDGTDPMKQTGSRVSPFFAFPTDRLRVFSGPNRFGYPSFVDVIGSSPYLYFSTGRADNNYQNAITLAAGTITPYQISSTRFANPTGFQIVSAGRDGVFGPGGLAWAGATGGGATQAGADDLANFHPTLLGVPAN